MSAVIILLQSLHIKDKRGPLVSFIRAYIVYVYVFFCAKKRHKCITIGIAWYMVNWSGMDRHTKIEVLHEWDRFITNQNNMWLIPMAVGNGKNGETDILICRNVVTAKLRVAMMVGQSY